MSIRRMVCGGLGLGGIASTLCSVTLAATMSADQFSPPKEIALADLLSVDALGYDCVAVADIDLAFHASGKGLRLPRTCLPEPCRAALTQVQLAGLIGRPPYQSEWDDYFSRYADFCRKEVVPFAGEETGPAAPADSAAAFWRPLVASYPASAPIRERIPPGIGLGSFRSSWGHGSTFPRGSGHTSPRGSGHTSARGSGHTSPWTGPPDLGDPPLRQDDPKPDDPPHADDPLTPVPVPDGLILWLTGLGCLIPCRRRAPPTSPTIPQRLAAASGCVDRNKKGPFGDSNSPADMHI